MTFFSHAGSVAKNSDLHHRGAEDAEVGKGFMKSLSLPSVLCASTVNGLLQTTLSGGEKIRIRILHHRFGKGFIKIPLLLCVSALNDLLQPSDLCREGFGVAPQRHREHRGRIKIYESSLISENSVSLW
jgi:hypothetical protein